MNILKLNKIKILTVIYIFQFSNISTPKQINLNVAGFILYTDGLGRDAVTFMHTLHDSFNINFINTHKELNLNNVPGHIEKIVSNSSLNKKADVSVLFDNPWHIYDEPYKKLPYSMINLAYTMIEASAIPEKWVTIFNNSFDAVVVPDEFLVDVYKNSGVKIPIFVLPLILFLQDFLQQPIKKSVNKPFTFGISAAFGKEKNHLTVIEGFAKEFGDNPNFRLRVHGRWGDTKAIKEKLRSLKHKNIELIEKIFTSKEHVNFLNSIDCYVLLSRGEGFSKTPREALAMGIPCVLTNHTAHKTICNTGFSIPVSAEIPMPIHYPTFKSDCGNQLNCTIEDSQQALRYAHQNYALLLKNAFFARQWVKQYLPRRLKQKYINLICPKNLLFGSVNKVTDNYLMTNSISLFNKYQIIQKKGASA